jgi:hypothetical protein
MFYNIPPIFFFLHKQTSALVGIKIEETNCYVKEKLKFTAVYAFLIKTNIEKIKNTTRRYYH